jgi:cardiolipin synthase
VCDDCLSTCGSTNIDFRSFEENFESNIFFYDNSTAMRLKRVFIADQQYCDLIDDASLITNRPFLSRLLESIIRMLSPLL